MDPLKTLIVEDNYNIQRLYTVGLPKRCFDLTFAADGDEGLKLYKMKKPNLVILDILMPQVSGYTLLKTIRKTMKDKTTAIVMASALSSVDDVQDCSKFNIQGYILKPFDLKKLAVQIINAYGQINPEQSKELMELYTKGSTA